MCTRLSLSITMPAGPHREPQATTTGLDSKSLISMWHQIILGCCPKGSQLSSGQPSQAPKIQEAGSTGAMGDKKTSLKGALRAGQGLRQQTGREGGEHSRSLGPQIRSAQRAEEAGPKMVLFSGAQAIRVAPIPIDTFKAKRGQHRGAQFPSAFPPLLPGHQIPPVLFPVENFLFGPWGVLRSAGPRVTWPARYTKSNHQKAVGC